MKFSLVFGALTALARSVAADGASVEAALQAVIDDTAALNTTVATWCGGLLQAVPITARATALLLTVEKGTQTARASANLTTLEALGVGTLTQTLVADVNSTLSTLVDAKPKFDRRLLGPAILLTLKAQRDASARFGAAVVDKIPPLVQGIARALVAQIDESFADAIAVYNPF